MIGFMRFVYRVAAVLGFVVAVVCMWCLAFWLSMKFGRPAAFLLIAPLGGVFLIFIQARREKIARKMITTGKPFISKDEYEAAAVRAKAQELLESGVVKDQGNDFTSSSRR